MKNVWVTGRVDFSIWVRQQYRAPSLDDAQIQLLFECWVVCGWVTVYIAVYTGQYRPRCSLSALLHPPIFVYTREQYRVLNIKYCVFFEDFKIFSVFPRCQCVYTHQAGRTPALQQNWQSSENNKILRKKHNIMWTPCILENIRQEFYKKIWVRL